MKREKCLCGEIFTQKDLREYREIDHYSSYPKFTCPNCGATIRCRVELTPTIKIDKIEAPRRARRILPDRVHFKVL